MAFEKPVLIIGAGIVGLTLAQALHKAGIPFEVYERDPHISSRDQGWAITIHWALSTLRTILDESTLAAVDATQVDPEVGRNDTGNFLFINLQTLETKFRIPPNERRRVNREQFRAALLKNVQDHVHWGKQLCDVAVRDHDDGVKAYFEDGTSVDGAVLVGAEGSNSRTRQFVAPDSYRNRPLPVRFVGVAVEMVPEQVKPLRDIDPLLFQGCHPETGNFLWVSMMSTPESNGTLGKRDEHYLVQIIMSWMTKETDKPIAEQETDATRLMEMRDRSEGFHPLLRHVVHSIPAGTSVIDVAVQDWPCPPFDNHNGHVTLVGDAAHAMTMYRGEAANHGILDAQRLAEAMADVHSGRVDLTTAINGYEREMRERSSAAVQLSRQACLDAHDFNGLNEDSAVLKRRALK